MQTPIPPPGDDTWAAACTLIMTSPSAREEDLRACREVMIRHSYDSDIEMSWPLAITVLGVAAAVAWGLPRCIRAFLG